MQAGLRGSHQPKSHFGVAAFEPKARTRGSPVSLPGWRPAPAALAARCASPSLLQPQPVLVRPVCGSLPCPSRARAPFCHLLRWVNAFSSCLLNLRLRPALCWTRGLVPFVVGAIRRCCCLCSFRPKSSSSAPLIFWTKLILGCGVSLRSWAVGDAGPSRLRIACWRLRGQISAPSAIIPPPRGPLLLGLRPHCLSCQSHVPEPCVPGEGTAAGSNSGPPGSSSFTPLAEGIAAGAMAQREAVPCSRGAVAFLGLAVIRRARPGRGALGMLVSQGSGRGGGGRGRREKCVGWLWQAVSDSGAQSDLLIRHFPCR